MLAGNVEKALAHTVRLSSSICARPLGHNEPTMHTPGHLRSWAALGLLLFCTGTSGAQADQTVPGAKLSTLALLAQQPPPHVPTEEELRLARGGAKKDAEREYQQESVHSFGQSARDAAAWVREKLSGLHITPARLLLGLGILGILITWNKNKKKPQWLVVTLFSYLLIIFGCAAMFLDWPYLN